MIREIRMTRGDNRMIDFQLRWHRNVLLAWMLLLVHPAAYANELNMAPMDCVINPSMIADLGSAEDGVLEVIQVDRSDLVHKGDVVAILESGVELAALELSRSRASLTAELDLRRVNAEFVNRQQRRTESLNQKNVISINEIDQNNTEATVSLIEYRQAKENLSLASLEKSRAEALLKRRTIRSPFMGVVTERFKSIGEYVNDQPIVRLAKLDPLHVEVLVPVEQAGQLRQGMFADIWSDALGDHRWQAEVSRIDQVADVASGTLGVRLILPNPKYKIRAGVRCRVAFSAGPTAQKKVARTNEEQLSTGKIEALKDVVKKAAPNKTSDATPSMAAANQCSWLGPFDSETAALDEAHRLHSNTLDVKLLKFSSDSAYRYRVTSAAAQTKSAARKTLRRFREIGEKDSYLYRAGAGNYFVSIGFYENRENALKHQGSIQSNNLVSRVVRQEVRNTDHWLRLTGNTAALDSKTRSTIDKSYLRLPDQASCQIPVSEGN